MYVCYSGATALSTVVKRKRKGKGLEKITQGLGAKVAIEIPEGMKHPEKPLPAAKFALEGGLIARHQTPDASLSAFQGVQEGQEYVAQLHWESGGNILDHQLIGNLLDYS